MSSRLSRAGGTHYDRCIEPGNVFRIYLRTCSAFRPGMLSMWGMCRALPRRTAPRRDDDVAQSSPTALRMGGSVIGRNQHEEDKGETGYSWFSFNVCWGSRLVL